MLPLLAAVLAVAPLDVPGCKTSKQEAGSLHANTSFEVTMTTPKSKLKQLLDCGGKPVALYVSEFAKAAEVSEAANFTGPQLWGGLAPTGEHTDELLQQGLIQVVVSGPGVRAATDALVAKGFKPWRGDAVDVLERVAKAIDCKAGSKDPLRAWCAATLTAGAGFKAAKDQTVLLGISAPLPSNRDLREVLLKATRVSALAFAGGKVRLTDVTPDNDDEAKQLLMVAGEISAALKGAGARVKISEGLAGFLPVLAGQAKDGAAVKDSAKGPAHAKLKSPTRLWLVKSGKLEVFVVAEDAADGAWLSVYPVVPAAAK
ncbi:MAG: hypothetical protein Q8L48_31935 [Archangium sp.]|nr:hypothetical protein [Archangium sp.]